MNAVIPFPASARQRSRHAPVRNETKSPGEAEVRQELGRILASAGFVQSRRMRRFLKFVVEETLGGRAAQLCEYSIGVSVFDRDESFEPGLDPIVRNDARRLRSKLLEYYQQAGKTHAVLINVPKGAYVPAFSFAAASRYGQSYAPYRLCVSLIRVADGSEMISKTFDLESSHCCLQLQLKA